MTAKPQVRRKSAHVAPRREFSHIRDLTPDPANRRKRTPRNVGMIVDALQKVGASRSIVIDERGEVLAGNGVLEAAAEAGITKVRVVDADGSTIIAVRRTGLSAKQKRDLAIYDNRAAELAEWDTAQLAADLEAGEDLSAFFFDDELKALLAKNVTVVEGLTDPDAVPELRTTDIVLGDLFQLGKHRLLCGDCTKAEDVALVADHADICFTSPPYGAANVAKLRDHYVRGKKKRESFYATHDDAPGEWLSMMGAWHAAVMPRVGSVVCNVQMLADNKRQMVEWVYAHREELCDVIIWDKVDAAPQMQSNVLSNAFEFLFIFGGNGSRTIPFAKFHGTIKNVIKINPRGKNEYAGVHRAVMPVELPLWVFADLCPLASSAMDPFAGTGTTVIAAEQAGRSCFAIEIDPSYCQVIIDRWEAFTGQKAVKQ